jgi:hypothetical protein
VRTGKDTRSRLIVALVGGLVLCGVQASSALAVPVAHSPIRAVEGASKDFTLATFSEGTSPLCGTYTAMIDWGDGITETKPVALTSNGLLSACGYTVNGTHTYTDESTHKYIVTITGNSPGATNGSATDTATIADATLTPAPVANSAVKDADFVGAVATFSDANPLAKEAEFSATIDWGDGTTGSGVVKADTQGGFIVSGTHKYTQVAAFNPQVKINDVGGSTASTAASIVVSPPPPTPPSGTTNAGSGTTQTTTSTQQTTPTQQTKSSTQTTQTTQTSAGTPAATGPLKLGLSAPTLVRGGIVVVQVRCPATERLCTGTVSATTVARKRSKQRALRRSRNLGSTVFIIGGGGSAELSIQPSRELRRLLLRDHSVRIALHAVAFDSFTGRRADAARTDAVRAARGARKG